MQVLVSWLYRKSTGLIQVGGYTFLWSGAPAGSPCQAGVALALDRYAYKAMMNWQPVIDRLLVANFRHSFGKLSVVAAYAPTEEAPDQQ